MDEEIEAISETIDVIVGYLSIYEDRLIKGLKANTIPHIEVKKTSEVVMGNIINELEEAESKMITDVLSEAENGSLSTSRGKSGTK